jgi:hypothetical protein
MAIALEGYLSNNIDLKNLDKHLLLHIMMYLKSF